MPCSVQELDREMKALQHTIQESQQGWSPSLLPEQPCSDPLSNFQLCIAHSCVSAASDVKVEMVMQGQP